MKRVTRAVGGPAIVQIAVGREACFPCVLLFRASLPLWSPDLKGSQPRWVVGLLHGPLAAPPLVGFTGSLVLALWSSDGTTDWSAACAHTTRMPPRRPRCRAVKGARERGTLVSAERVEAPARPSGQVAPPGRAGGRRQVLKQLPRYVSQPFPTPWTILTTPPIDSQESLCRRRIKIKDLFEKKMIGAGALKPAPKTWNMEHATRRSTGCPTRGSCARRVGSGGLGRCYECVCYSKTVQHDVLQVMRRETRFS